MIEITDEELTFVIRTLVLGVDKGGYGAAKAAAIVFKALGITANMHVSEFATVFTPRMTLEWYAGQLVDITESESWFAMNSLINCLDKFVPAPVA